MGKDGRDEIDSRQERVSEKRGEKRDRRRKGRKELKKLSSEARRRVDLGVSNPILRKKYWPADELNELKKAKLRLARTPNRRS